MNWQESVANAIRRTTKNTSSRVFTRQQLIEFELQQIVRDVGAKGKTPNQTLSRVLQELRQQGVIEFISPGVYRSSIK